MQGGSFGLRETVAVAVTQGERGRGEERTQWGQLGL